MDNMGKREKKIEIIKQYITRVAHGGYTGYAYGSIPTSKLNNALSSYAGGCNANSVIGMIDTSFPPGNGKKGVIFTDARIYWDTGLFGGTGSTTYVDIYQKKTVPQSLLAAAENTNAMNEMLGKLAATEDTSLQDSLISLGGSLLSTFLDSLNEAVNESAQVQEQADESVESIPEISNDAVEPETIEVVEERNIENTNNSNKIFCKYCGKQIDADSVFCQCCGKKLN